LPSSRRADGYFAALRLTADFHRALDVSSSWRCLVTAVVSFCRPVSSLRISVWRLHESLGRLSDVSAVCAWLAEAARRPVRADRLGRPSSALRKRAWAAVREPPISHRGALRIIIRLMEEHGVGQPTQAPAQSPPNSYGRRPSSRFPGRSLPATSQETNPEGQAAKILDRAKPAVRKQSTDYRLEHRRSADSPVPAGCCPGRRSLLPAECCRFPAACARWPMTCTAANISCGWL
jgi:hypothetical protein